MSSKTKIVVLRMKELIYTGIFVLLGILLILLLVTMFAPDKEAAPAVEHADLPIYKPGVYTTSILLGGNAVDLEVIAEADYLASIRLVNLSEAIATMYPLMEPALDHLTEQIFNTQSLEGLTYPEENQYTSMVILDAIEMAVEKAKLPPSQPEAEPNAEPAQ